MEKEKLLVIDNEEAVRAHLSSALSEEYAVLSASGAQSAMEALRSERPPLVTLDLSMAHRAEDPGEGFRLLVRILQQDPITKVVIITGNNDKSSALTAISLGAYDFFTKPINIDLLKTVLKRAHYVRALEEEHRKLQKECWSRQFGEIIGNSECMQDVFAKVRKIATTDVPVLITGGSGTGKELVARAIHSSGLRAAKPFVPINCGAIPDNLLESELFGHEKGAFTGAHIQRTGRIEMAGGGTLFLDEIGELPPALQVKILRFLQDSRIERVGGREAIEVDIRVIAATNSDVKKLISEERFREDLYYRLAVVTIELPPLRERGEDKALLARAFLQKFSNERSQVKTLSPEALEAINDYDWPGNVRELENRIRRAITFADGPAICPSDMGFGEAGGVARALDLKKAKEELESRFVNLAIIKHRGNISRAAEELGLSRPTVHNIIKKYNIMK